MPAEDIEPTEREQESLKAMLSFADQIPRQRPMHNDAELREILQDREQLQKLRTTIGDLLVLYRD